MRSNKVIMSEKIQKKTASDGLGRILTQDGVMYFGADPSALPDTDPSKLSYSDGALFFEEEEEMMAESVEPLDIVFHEKSVVAPEFGDFKFDIIEFEEHGSDGRELEEDFLLEHGDPELPGFEDEILNAHKGHTIPGASTNAVIDDEEEEPKRETTWEEDRDSKKFMEYLADKYPSGIPQHDGKSLVGCERAINYLNRLNKEISEALRGDAGGEFDLQKLEDIRVKMMSDMDTLKTHMKKLQRKLRDSHKTAEDAEELAVKTGSADIIKEAKSGKFSVYITAFERAITGIISNAVVSSGRPFDDVYEALKKKYDFTEREELSILQILMDMGHPIFKDRGTLSDKKDSDSDDDTDKGIDFVRNYFA
jgi:hypothetical protein